MSLANGLTWGQERSQARSMVITTRGITATSQALASQAGAQVLARGGNAIDAALAANAVMSVVEPMSCGIGGDLFAIYWDAKTGKLTGINASGWAPKGLTIARLKAKGATVMPETGIDSVSVPGCVDGWEKLHKRFGRLKWSELFQPAIYYASHGFPVTEVIQDHWVVNRAKLAANEYARSVFLPGGRPPALGEVFRNPDLAKALRAIASSGASAVYRGEIAAAILATSKSFGGAMAADDLAEFSAEWVDPISTGYRGWKVYELPPNVQGVAALEMLNIMERFPLGEFGFADPRSWHVKMEAQKLAYADLRRYIADPRFAKIPLAGLLSKEYGAARASAIAMDRAPCPAAAGEPRMGTDTIYLSVVDRDGNIASLIQSIYLQFGSGIAVDGYGFHLHNRAALFDLDPAHPNALAPRKRPFHTIIPGFMEKGDVHIGFGIMGGLNQAQAHAQFVSNVVDHGMNPQAALEAPRFTRATFDGCEFTVENRLPEAVRAALKAKGHVLAVAADYSGRVGGGQVVVHNSKTRVNFGASDPRKDGAATPEPDDYFHVR